MTESKPILWHIPVSHYSEKARWALAHKGVEHERRTPLPGVHVAYAKWLTRGESATLPVLRLGGETLGDSTAIIGALERRFPEPALYPADPPIAIGRSSSRSSSTNGSAPRSACSSGTRR